MWPREGLRGAAADSHLPLRPFLAPARSYSYGSAHGSLYRAGRPGLRPGPMEAFWGTLCHSVHLLSAPFRRASSSAMHVPLGHCQITLRIRTPGVRALRTPLTSPPRLPHSPAATRSPEGADACPLMDLVPRQEEKSGRVAMGAPPPRPWGLGPWGLEKPHSTRWLAGRHFCTANSPRPRPPRTQGHSPMCSIRSPQRCCSIPSHPTPPASSPAQAIPSSPRQDGAFQPQSSPVMASHPVHWVWPGPELAPLCLPLTARPPVGTSPLVLTTRLLCSCRLVCLSRW